MKRFAKLGAAVVLFAGLSQSAVAGPIVPLDAVVQPTDRMIVPAQFTLQFGASDRKIRRNLRAQGYTEITIVGRQLARATAEACKGGVRYRIEIRSSGRIRRANEIGQCKRVVTIDDAEKILQEDGYRRISIEEVGDVPFIAIACKQGDRIRVRMNKFGEITGRRELGRCQQALRPDDIRVKLREDGYNRIEFTDRQLPRYVAEACRNNRRIRLTINRRGEIRNRQRIGRCDPPLRPRQIRANLEERGLDRIEIVDNRPPRYVVEACRGQKRVEITLGHYGKILREYRIGRCQQPLTRANLLVEMRKNGYRRVRFNTIPGTDYETEACRERKRFTTRWTQYGEVISERDRGPCVSPRLAQIVGRFEDRGLKKATVIIEGCRRGRKIRITVDEFTGDRLDRQRVGRC
ncbi:MAG: hypothetical protein ACR2O4_06050 [Hyphomicrobiaceae bacterium]